MNSDNRTKTIEAFTDVLGKLAFMFAEPVEDGESGDTPRDALQAEVQFSGPLHGRLSVAVPREWCSELAANILGVDEEDDAALENLTDALKEVANVSCGHLLTAVAGEQPQFDLSPPEINELSEDDWCRLRADSEKIPMNIDEINPVLLRFEVMDTE